MSDPIWLSVVTVVKDDNAGFARSLESLTTQDLSGVEFLVVDSSLNREDIPKILDASTVHARCERIQLQHMPPEGIYAAMNRGLALASGRFIYFLNAGDEFAGPAVLATAKASAARSGASWLYGRAEIIGVDGTVTITPDWSYQDEQRSGFRNGHFPSHQSTIVSTALLASIGGFDTSYRIAADYDAFLQTSLISDPNELDMEVCRFHEGGASTSHWARATWEFHRARQRRLAVTGKDALRERVSTLRQFALSATYRSPWPLALLLALATWIIMTLVGVPLANAGLLVLFTAIQTCAGALWWRLVQPRRSISILETLGVGLALGTAGAMLSGLVTTWWFVVVLVGAVWWLRVRRNHLAPLGPLSKPEFLAVLIGLVPGVGAFLWAIRSYPLSWTGLWTGYHGDMPFFEALAASVARLGPGTSIFMDGAALRYHSLAYGWAGQLTSATGAEPFVVLTRLLPLVMLIGAITLAVAWTRRLSESSWAPSLAAMLIVTGGFVGATFGGILNFDSPSQSVGVVWLLGLSIIFLRGLNPDVTAWFLLPVGVLGVALTGGKVSTAAIGGFGLGILTLVAFARREQWRWRAALATGVTGVTMVGTYLWLLAGSANAGGLNVLGLLDRASSVQGLNPVITNRGVIAGIAILAVAISFRWAGLAWLVADPTTRWKPETTYGVALACGGLAALVVLSGGFNDLWFAAAASAPLAVLSATGTASAVRSLDPESRRRIWIAPLAGITIALVVAGIWTTGSTGILGNGWRWAGPIVGLVLAVLVGIGLAFRAEPDWRRATLAFTVVVLVVASLPSKIVYGVASPLASAPEGTRSSVLFRLQPDYIETIDRSRSVGWTDTQTAAGQWLRENADPSDLVATNLTLSSLVSALSHRTTYISAIHMQAPYGFSDDFSEIQRREAESWAFINKPSTLTIDPLCAAGVRWVWVDSERSNNRDWEPFAETAAVFPDVTILRINPSACS